LQEELLIVRSDTQPVVNATEEKLQPEEKTLQTLLLEAQEVPVVPLIACIFLSVLRSIKISRKQ
jgi:hypothetical protein